MTSTKSPKTLQYIGWRGLRDAPHTCVVGCSYPMASVEEVMKHEDKCAICWEPMTEARKLPCKHLFHKSVYDTLHEVVAPWLALN